MENDFSQGAARGISGAGRLGVPAGDAEILRHPPAPLARAAPRAVAAADGGDGGDPALARRAWDAFHVGLGDQLNVNSLVGEAEWRRARIDGPVVLEAVDEAHFVSTNDAAQYGLAAIQNLALIGEHLECCSP